MLKNCSNKACTIVNPQPFSSFSPSKKNKHGLNSQCKSCRNAYGCLYRKNVPEQKRKDQSLYRKRHPGKVNANIAKRDAAQKLRTPAWLTEKQLKEIEQFYLDAAYLTNYTKMPFQVDHILPILGKAVSGLHVAWNLQILTAEENNRKGNRL